MSPTSEQNCTRSDTCLQYAKRQLNATRQRSVLHITSSGEMTFRYNGLLTSPSVPPANWEYVWLRTSGKGEAYTKYNTLRKALTSRDLPTTYVTTTNLLLRFQNSQSVLRSSGVGGLTSPSNHGLMSLKRCQIHARILPKPQLLQKKHFIVEWLAFLLSIRRVLSSNLCLKISYNGLLFMILFSPWRQIPIQYITLFHDIFLQRTFQSTRH